MSLIVNAVLSDEINNWILIPQLGALIMHVPLNQVAINYPKYAREVAHVKYDDDQF